MKATKPQQNISRDLTPGSRRLVVVSEFAFLVIGVGLTLAAFLFLNMFVTQMMRNEYERITENTVTALSKDFFDLERSINTTATLMSVYGTLPDETLFQKIAQSDPGLKHFDQVIFMYKKPDGQWEYKNFYKGADARYTIKPSRKLIDYITGQNYTPEGSAHVVIDPALFASTGETGARPFALVRPATGLSEGYVIGTSHAGVILNPAWQGEHEQILRISIRDVSENYDIFQMVRKTKGREMEGAGRSYEFPFGGHRWEARTEYAMEEKAYFLMAVPYFVIIFGFILAAAGTLYIHGTQRQSHRVSLVNNALEQKNKQLQREMLKREYLHSVMKKSEAENQSIIDSVSDIIFETDTGGKILFLNATWYKVTGFEAEQSRGLNLFNMLHPQDQDRLRQDFHALVRGQKQTYRSFTRLRTANGTFRAIEIAISMTRQDENKNLRVVGTIIDVEERRRAERALGEAEKKYRTIVENAAGGIFQLTPEGVYLSANPALARILGYNDAEDLLRTIKNANESVYFNSRERQYFLKELENTGIIHNYETQAIRKDGARIWVNENVRVVKDETGGTLYYEGALEDITQRKQAEIGLREAKIHSDLANRAKSEFLSNMSHELRTPLNSIIGFSEIIKNETFGPVGQEPYKEYAKDIFESGKNLLSVISEILDIAKIEAGDRHLNDDIVDLHQLMEGCMKLLENKAAGSNLVVSNLMKDVPQIVGEEVAIKQILVNLLSNAIKFTPAGGRVTITNDMDSEGALRLCITDTGVGLDEAEIEKALSPFGQLNSALSRKSSGSGLGLTLAQSLVKLHDGRLELFSQKGIGTTVAVVFPADRVSKKKAAQPAVSPKKENT